MGPKDGLSALAPRSRSLSLARSSDEEEEEVVHVNKRTGPAERRGEIGFPHAARLPEETSRFD